MKKINIIFMLFLNFCIYADTVNFPPELLWWINELKKADKDIEINKFELIDTVISDFDSDYITKEHLIYPILMRWNYSGNYVAYNNHHYIDFYKEKSGKYSYGGGGDDSGFLAIADNNKNVFFYDFFGMQEGLDAVQWLTDTVLVGVGCSIMHPFIKTYKINKKNVEIKTYYYTKKISIENRNLLKLSWFEQRPDYFELKE